MEKAYSRSRTSIIDLGIARIFNFPPYPALVCRDFVTTCVFALTKLCSVFVQPKFVIACGAFLTPGWGWEGLSLSSRDCLLFCQSPSLLLRIALFDSVRCMIVGFAKDMHLATCDQFRGFGSRQARSASSRGALVLSPTKLRRRGVTRSESFGQSRVTEMCKTV